MKIKGLLDEDFVNYKVPSLFISTAFCSFKCDIAAGSRICQNSVLANQPTHDINDQEIVNRYCSNRITKAIVFGGLEPFDQIEELCALIKLFRDRMIDDDIVIYTGFNKSEVQECIELLKNASHNRNLVIKFGRFIPDQKPHFDDVLGVYLASENQYAERIC